MFVATTLALSLVFSPVTALTQAPVGPANPTTSSATPATTPTTPATTPPAGPPASKPAAASKPAGTACEKLDYRARVDVDASALGADGQGVATRLRTKVEQELRGNDFMLGAAGDAIPQMTVKVISLPGEDEGYKYTIDITHGDASPIRDGSSVGECPLCTESELLEKVVGAARALAPKLRAYVADYNNRPCPNTCGSDADCKNPAEPHCNQQTHTCEQESTGCSSDSNCPADQHCQLPARICVDDGTTPPPPSGLTGKQKAGVALLAVGAVGVGVGIGLLVKKPVADNPMEAWSYTTTKPPGIALLAVGGVAVATGVVLFILGRRPQPPRNQVTPVAGAGFYGLSWSGRF